MPDAFDGASYLLHLRSRWRLAAIVLAIALAAALLLSLLQTTRYTAETSLVIEPPAGSDARTATAVSPIYLESLRTYEHLASSDHLFAQAVEKFQLRSSGSIESLKRRLLQVSIPRNTKILRISVTLPDPRKAQAVAQYLAEETVRLNRRTNRSDDDELVADARTAAAEARGAFDKAEAQYRAVRSRVPTPDGLAAELEDLRERRADTERSIMTTELSIADQQLREKSASAKNSEDLAPVRDRLHATEARAGHLRQQASTLASEISGRQALLAQRSAENDATSNAYKAARATLDQVEKRLYEIQGMVGFRNERLTILDPGVVPERPSSPNVPLNLVISGALALVASLMYLTFEFGFRSENAGSPRVLPRMVGKS